jgi:hypothetical protein
MEKKPIIKNQEEKIIFEKLKPFALKRIKEYIVDKITLEEAKSCLNHLSIEDYDDKEIFTYELYSGILEEIQDKIAGLDSCDCDTPIKEIFENIEKDKPIEIIKKLNQIMKEVELMDNEINKIIPYYGLYWRHIPIEDFDSDEKITFSQPHNDIYWLDIATKDSLPKIEIDFRKCSKIFKLMIQIAELQKRLYDLLSPDSMKQLKYEHLPLETITLLDKIKKKTE